jgi:hypothetical protein
MKIKLYMIEQNGKYLTTFRKRQVKQFLIDNIAISDKNIHPFQWANKLFHRLELGQSIVLTINPIRIIRLCDWLLLDTSSMYLQHIHLVSFVPTVPTGTIPLLKEGIDNLKPSIV